VAITLDTASLTRKEYSWRIEIFAEAGDPDPEVVFHREVRSLDANGALIGAADRSVAPVRRRLSAVAARSFATLDGGKTMTGAEIASLLAKAGDDLREEDIAAAGPGAPAP
jgi:hypothetical protein